MVTSYPVTHSILNADVLLEDVVARYDIGRPRGCWLLYTNLNDTYLVRTDQADYILRVYRQGWRSPEAIQDELDFLLHLRREEMAVAVPLQGRDEERRYALPAPEGERFSVLFSYAPGRPVSFDDEATARAFGAAVAALHTAADAVPDLTHRPVLDLRHLLDEPLQVIEPHLRKMTGHEEYVRRLAGQVRAHLETLAPGLNWGPCHGDLHGGNAHMETGSGVTFFDFDCSGMGWRAYDLAAFRWVALTRKRERRQWEPFLEGYAERRPVDRQELEAVAWFLAARHVWLLGLHIAHRRHTGMLWLTETYLEDWVAWLRRWERRFVEGTNGGDIATRSGHPATLMRSMGRHLKAIWRSSRPQQSMPQPYDGS